MGDEEAAMGDGAKGDSGKSGADDSGAVKRVGESVEPATAGSGAVDAGASESETTDAAAVAPVEASPVDVSQAAAAMAAAVAPAAPAAPVAIDDALARTPLGRAPAPRGLAVALSEAPLTAMITVRGDLGSDAMATAVREAVGVSAPSQRRAQLNGERRALWMSPDELLLQAPYADRERVLAACESALAGTPHLAIDVSDARARFVLEGEGAREVLAKGMPIDLSASAFFVGEVRRSRLSTVAAAALQVSADPDVIELVCFRSYADYVWRWLIASSREGSLPHVL